MIEDLQEFKAAVRRHISDPTLRPSDTALFISSIGLKCRDLSISDDHKLVLAKLGRELVALQTDPGGSAFARSWVSA